MAENKRRGRKIDSDPRDTPGHLTLQKPYPSEKGRASYCEVSPKGKGKGKEVNKSPPVPVLMEVDVSGSSSLSSVVSPPSLVNSNSNSPSTQALPLDVISRFTISQLPMRSKRLKAGSDFQPKLDPSLFLPSPPLLWKSQNTPGFPKLPLHPDLVSSLSPPGVHL